MGAGLRWRATDPGAADDLSAGDRIRRHLEASGEERSAEELAEALGLKPKTVQNTVGALVRDRRVARTGAGTKADPFRYVAAGTIREPIGTQDPASSRRNPRMVPDAPGHTPAAGGTIRGDRDGVWVEGAL